METPRHALTVISLPAPPNRHGEITTRGGEVLTVSARGHLKSNLGQKVDLHGRPTKARGSRGSGAKKWEAWAEEEAWKESGGSGVAQKRPGK